MKPRVAMLFLLASAIGVLLGFTAYNLGNGHTASANGLMTLFSRDPARAAVKDSPGFAGNPSWAGMPNVFGRSAAGSPHATAASDADVRCDAEYLDASMNTPQPERLRNMQAAFTATLLQSTDHAFGQLGCIPEELRRKVVSHGLAALAQKAPDQFSSLASTLQSDQRIYLPDALRILAKTNPTLAYEFVRQHKSRQDLQAAITGSLIPQLLHSSPALGETAVQEMIRTVPVALLQQVATTKAKQDPTLAYEWLKRSAAHGRTEISTQMMNDITSSIVASNPARAADYLNQTADPMVRKSLLAEISMQQSADNLDSAWAWLNQYKGDPAFAETALNLLAHWSYSKPEEVARILPAVEDPDMQSVIGAQLARFWQKTDPARYQTWSSSLPAGAMREGAAQRY